MTLEARIGRLLTIGTYAGAAALAVGVVAMLAAGISPLDATYPTFDPLALPGQLVRLEPRGFLWLGLVVIVATPVMRVVASLVGYLGRSERAMAAVATGVLAVIAVGIGVGAVLGIVKG